MWSVKVSASLNLSQISGVENDHTTGTLSVHWATYLLRWQKKEMQVSLRENQDLHEYVDTNTGNKQKHITTTSD